MNKTDLIIITLQPTATEPERLRALVEELHGHIAALTMVVTDPRNSDATVAAHCRENVPPLGGDAAALGVLLQDYATTGRTAP